MTSSKSEYKPTIGIECHVQLNTKTKLFSAVENDARNAKPNTLISHICLGMPGALPVLNKKAVELACKAAFALNTKPQKFSKFDRKHYFYPDLPKGYQISQYDQPIILGGFVNIKLKGKVVKISITRAHLEEDAGKSTHPTGKNYSLVDLNRAGTPLLEIVSEPDMHSSEEARAFAKELFLLMKYSGVSDANLFYGNMRFDVNISLSKTNKLGVRSEIKNLNSFKSVEKAVDYEIKRQTELLGNNQPVVQETRGWDDSKQQTFSQRTKEDAHDYRYFPDPDIPPVTIDEEYIDSIHKNMPPMPDDIRAQLKCIGLANSVIENLLEEPLIGNFVFEISKITNKENYIRIANWFSSEVQARLADSKLELNELKLIHENFINLAEMANSSKINSSAAKEILFLMIKTGDDPNIIAKSENLIQISDSSEIENIVRKVIQDNPKASDDIKRGEQKVIGFLVGQVMKESKGKANPEIANKLIQKIINK